MVTRTLAVLLCVSLLAASRSARADGDATCKPPPNLPEPRVHHAPPAVTRADAELELSASFERPDLVKRALVVYKRPGGQLAELQLRRSSQGDRPFVAIVPAADVSAPTLAYTIEIEQTDGRRVSAFASREEMHAVSVQGDIVDAREQELLAKLGGRRSVLSASAEFANFGRTPASVYDGATTSLVTRDFSDQYYRLEASYTYRVLRTVAEFGIRSGIVRGTSVVPNERDPSKFDVGLNYGAPRLRLRATDWLHVEGEALTSVTEIGFSVGGGGAVIVGDPYATRFTLGFESIQVFGTRGYSRFDVVASHRLMLAPIIEVTNMPHAKSAGVRLLVDAGIDLGAGFGIALRGGYQARSFNEGGPSLGVTTLYAF